MASISKLPLYGALLTADTMGRIFRDLSGGKAEEKR